MYSTEKAATSSSLNSWLTTSKDGHSTVVAVIHGKIVYGIPKATAVAYAFPNVQPFCFPCLDCPIPPVDVYVNTSVLGSGPTLSISLPSQTTESAMTSTETDGQVVSCASFTNGGTDQPGCAGPTSVISTITSLATGYSAWQSHISSSSASDAAVSKATSASVDCYVHDSSGSGNYEISLSGINDWASDGGPLKNKLKDNCQGDYNASTWEFYSNCFAQGPDGRTRNTQQAIFQFQATSTKCISRAVLDVGGIEGTKCHDDTFGSNKEY